MTDTTYEFVPGSKAPIYAWTRGVPMDEKSKGQLRNIANMPFIHHHVAAMPDVHFGIGATIGSVIPTKGAVIPASVGVDIGCGMAAVKLRDISASLLPDDLSEIRSRIEQTIPVGFGKHSPDKWDKLYAGTDAAAFLRFLRDSHPKIVARRKDDAETIAVSQFGTLGGGNHFIELCLDKQDGVWVMLHSGSRGIGNAIGTYFIELAKQDMRTHFINLPDSNLAYLPEGTEHFKDYMYAVAWAQGYAARNREHMLASLLRILSEFLPRTFISEKAVNCHHNYVDRENHYGENVLVTRKGAVRAREGDLGIIPGSMGARSFIVRGKGNPASFHSCSHGAGRVMSRGEAKRKITIEDHEAATAGVECRKDSGVLDESPAAYKDIQAVMAAQADLVDVVAELKQVLCVKG